MGVDTSSSDYDVNFSKSFSVILFSPEYDLHFPVLPGLKTSYSIHIYVKMMSGDLIPFTVASNCNNSHLYSVVLYYLNSIRECESESDFVLYRSNKIIQQTPFYLYPKENEVFFLFIQR